MSIDIEDAGNPRRKTKSGDSSGESTSGGTSSSGGSGSSSRSSRVSVTPRDPEKLEEVADELGLPKSKIYNMGFKALLEKLGYD